MAGRGARAAALARRSSPGAHISSTLSPLGPGLFVAAPGVPEQILRLVVESVRDYAIFVLDVDGRVMTWNIGAQRIKGYDAHEILGRHFSTFYPPEEVASGKPAFELEVAAREGRFEDEGWRLRKDGTRFWANVIITAMRERGTLRGFAKVTRDLTARREAEETARRLAAEQAAREERERAAKERLQLYEAERCAREEAERIGHLQEQLMAIVGHDLRTPLSAITMGAQLLLRRGGLAPEQEASVGRIAGSAKRMNGIIRDLLDFSGARQGRGIPVAKIAMDLADVCRRTLPELEASAGARRLGFGATGDTHLQGDPDRLAQVVTNLVANALQHGTGSEVRVRVCGVSGLVRLEVHNDGPPIPREILPSLFEPFRRGRTADAGREAGLAPTPVVAQSIGLGLYIVREIVRAHGGEVSVSSEEGAGTTFTVSLPRTAE